MIAAPDPLIVVTDAASPLVHLHLWFPVGPPLDPPGKEGLTALTVRSLIRGTRSRSRAAVEEEVEGLGSELVTSTQRQAIGIGGTLLARHLDRFIGILTEVVTAPAFADGEIEKTRREMIAELATIVDDDNALARRWFRRTLFDGTPYAHGTNGWIPSLAALTPDDVRAWHARWFSRASLVVGASGPLDRDGLAATLAPLLAALPEGERPDWDLATAPTPPARIRVVDKADRGQAQILMGQPTIAATHPDTLALGLATTAFGGTFTGRLMQEVRVKRGLSYGAYAHLAGERVGGHYLLQAAPEAADAAETVALLRDEYRRFIVEGLDDDELAFARQNTIASFAFAVETPGLLASQRVRARLLDRPDGYVEAYRDRIAGLDADTVRAVVRQHLDPEALTSVIVGRADTLVPALEALGGPVEVVAAAD